MPPDPAIEPMPQLALEVLELRTAMRFRERTIREWRLRAERAEQMLDGSVNAAAGLKGRAEKAEAALESIAANTCCDRCQEAALVARAALAHKGRRR